MTMWLNASGTKHKNPFEEKAKLAKENIDYINPSPEFENGTLNSIQSGRKLAIPPIPSRLVPMQMLSSHTPTRIGSGYKSAFIVGTLNSLLGKALTPVAEKIAGRKVDLSTLPQPTTFGEKALSFGSGMVADLPLWLAGDALLAKPLSALAKTKPLTKATGLLPKAITPALGTGIRAGTTYGLPINALETALDGDGIEGFTDRLKQAPLMGLGGTALHGAGQLVGKGVKSGVDYAKFNKLTKLPEMQVNPLDDIQNAYKAPSLRDARTRQYENIFADTSDIMATTRPASIRTPLQAQGTTEAELIAQRQLDAQSAFGGPVNRFKLKDRITPEQRAYDIRQAELESVFSAIPTGSIETPLARNTLQQNIDNSLGMGGASGYQGLEAFGRPLNNYKLKQTIKPGQRAYEAKQSELEEVFKELPIGSVETPVARKTLQEGIDSSLGIGGQEGTYQGLDAFGKPIKSFKVNKDTQNAITEITAKMTKQVNDIAKSLKQVDGQTSIETIRAKVKAMGGIKQGNADIFEEQKVIPNWIRNNKTGRPLDEVADTLGMTSDELLAAISDSSYKQRDYITEAYRIAHNDPEYQALSNTLDMLKSELPGKKTLPRTSTNAQADELELFHGTNAEFDSFDLSKGDTMLSGKGVYFSTNQSEAAGYGKNVKNVRINNKDILDFDSLDSSAQEQIKETIYSGIRGDNNAKDALAGFGKTKEKVFTKAQKNEAMKFFEELEEKTKGYIQDRAKPRVSTRDGDFVITWREIDGIKYGDNVVVYNTDIIPKSTSNGNLTKSDIKLKPRELTPKPEPTPIQPKKLELSGTLPVDNPAPLPIKPNVSLKPREIKRLGQTENQPQRLGLSGTLPANVPPKIKPRATLKPRTLNEPQPIEPRPIERVLPGKPERLMWTNKEDLGRLPNGEVKTLIKEAPIKPSEPPVIDQINARDIPDAPAHPIAEKIMSKLDDYEAEVRARIASNKRRLNAGLPLDTMTDYAIIGGIKIARGTVKYSVWAADMVNDLGTSVKPHLKEIWEESNKQHSLMVDGTFSTALPKPQSEIVIGKPKESLGFKDSLKKFYTKVVNAQQPIVDAGKLDGSDIGKLASNSKNVSGIVDYNFLKGMVNKNGDEVGVSLKSVVEAIPKGKEKDFWTYMSQKHNIDRAREGKPVQANYTPNMSKQAVDIAERENPEYKAVGDSIVKWLDDFMTTWGVDTGIVNKELYQGLRQTYKNYFPTQRDFSELEKAIPDNVTQKFADQKTPIRKATGSERDIIDPTENIMNLVNRTIRTAKYNEVGQSLLNSVRQAPEKLKPVAEVIKTKDGMFSNKDNVITVLEDGKPVYLQINDKPLLDAMNGLPKSIGDIPVLSTLTNGFKQLITQSNPIFAIRNIFRDIPTAYVYGSEANPLKFGAGLIGAGKDIVTNSSRLKKYQAVGGGGANFFGSSDITKSAAELTGKGSKIKKVISSPVKAIQKFNNMTETAPRLAEFNRVLEKTGDVNKALFAANDVTVNFSRGGNITKNVDKAVPYLSAGVQGLDKFFRGFVNPKNAISTITKSGVAITTPTLALYLVNKDNPNYQTLDNRTKDSYYLIPKEDGTFIKLPKSRELGVLFSSLLERGLRQAEGQDGSFKGFGNTVATNFSPANPIDSNFFAPATWNIATNKDFANRAIVPQSMVMDKRSPYLQYDEKTTSIAKAIGELSNKVVEGGVSPKQLDYLVKSYSGVLGQFGMPLVTPGGSPKKTLTNQFTADPTFSNQSTTDFYDKLDKLSAKAIDKNIIEKIPSKKLTPEENMKNSMNGVSSALSRGTKLINSIQASDAPDKDDRIKKIKTQMIELSRKGVLADTPKLMQKVENESKKYFNK